MMSLVVRVDLDLQLSSAIARTQSHLAVPGANYVAGRNAALI